MKKFYLHNGKEQEGPFDLEDLKIRNITKQTPVWFEGLEGWTTADKVDELNSLFKSHTPPPFEQPKNTPPPFEEKQAPETKTVVKKSKTGLIVASVIGLIGIFILSYWIFQNMNNSGTWDGSGNPSDTYQEKVMTVEEIEKADPAKFLNASGTYNENFWGDKLKIHGNVINNATVANYKDVIVEIVFFTETDTELKRERYIIYDRFPAHTTNTFELKINRPANCKKLGWEAVGATPY